MTVSQQIAVLLALTNNLFDLVPLAKMRKAELALVKAADTLPDDIVERFRFSDKLNNNDRAAILQLANETLTIFQQHG